MLTGGIILAGLLVAGGCPGIDAVGAEVSVCWGLAERNLRPKDEGRPCSAHDLAVPVDGVDGAAGDAFGVAIVGVSRARCGGGTGCGDLRHLPTMSAARGAGHVRAPRDAPMG